MIANPYQATKITKQVLCQAVVAWNHDLGTKLLNQVGSKRTWWVAKLGNDLDVCVCVGEFVVSCPFCKCHVQNTDPWPSNNILLWRKRYCIAILYNFKMKDSVVDMI